MKIPDAYIFGRPRAQAYWTPRCVAAVAGEARRRAAALREASQEEIVSALDGAGSLFRRGGPWRGTALEHLRRQAPFCAAALQESLDALVSLTRACELERRMRLELFSPEALDQPQQRPGYDGMVLAAPKGVVLHVGAGNVFLGLIDSLVLGLLTRNANILKTSSQGSQFAVLFALALRQTDRRGRVAQAVAALHWPGGRADLESAVLQHCDAAMIWGGEEAVAAYRRQAPAKTHVCGFGPKASLAVAMPGVNIAAAAEAAARDVCLWDQSACASPHCLYAICPDPKQRSRMSAQWSQALARALARMQEALPQGRLTPDETAEITKARELAKVDAALGQASCLSSFPRSHWTVISETDDSFRVSPQNRVLYVKCAGSLQEVAARLEPYRGYVQSAGVAGSAAQRLAAARILATAGVTRVCPLGSMLSGATGSPHDGTFPMRQLVNWVAVERLPSPLERAEQLAAWAKRRSPFYARHLRRADPSDFSSLPLLSQKHILAHTPPKNRDMLTGPLTGGVYFASGGSTGSPKYVFYETPEYERTARALAAAMQAGGLEASDRVANLFVAGNLWSSWLTVEKALAFTPAVSVPVGSALPLETVVKYLREFQVTALVGLPSYLLKLAQAAGRLPLRRIFYGGEYVGPAMERYFQKAFPGVAVRSAAFATVDAGVVGFQCEKARGSIHHLCDQDQLLEILDPKTRKPVAAGATGELVVTCLNKLRMPIIRFRLGDLGRWISQPCACGRSQRLFEILGRCDDRVHAGGAHIFVSDVAAAVGGVPGLSHQFQIIVRRQGRGDGLVIRAEGRDSPRRRASLQAAILRRCEDLAYSVEHGWIARPEIEIVAPDSLPRSARTGKLRRVVDERIARLERRS